VQLSNLGCLIFLSSIFPLSWSCLNSNEECWLCVQAPSPDGSAVLENSEQFQVHLKAAIMDPRVKEYVDQPFTHHIVLMCSAACIPGQLEQNSARCIATQIWESTQSLAAC